MGILYAHVRSENLVRVNQWQKIFNVEYEQLQNAICKLYLITVDVKLRDFQY